MHWLARASPFAFLSLDFLLGEMGPELLPRRDVVGLRHSHWPGTAQGSTMRSRTMTIQGILRAGPLGSLFLQDLGSV